MPRVGEWVGVLWDQGGWWFGKLTKEEKGERAGELGMALAPRARHIQRRNFSAIADAYCAVNAESTVEPRRGGRCVVRKQNTGAISSPASSARAANEVAVGTSARMFWSEWVSGEWSGKWVDGVITRVEEVKQDIAEYVLGSFFARVEWEDGSKIWIPGPAAEHYAAAAAAAAAAWAPPRIAPPLTPAATQQEAPQPLSAAPLRAQALAVRLALVKTQRKAATRLLVERTLKEADEEAIAEVLAESSAAL